MPTGGDGGWSQKARTAAGGGGACRDRGADTQGEVQGLVEDGPRIGQTGPQMVRGVDEPQGHLAAAGSQRVGELFALGARDEPVGRPVGEQEGRSAGAGVGDRARLRSKPGRVGDGRTDQPGLPGIRRVGHGHGVGAGLALHGPQVGRPVPVHDTDHIGVRSSHHGVGFQLRSAGSQSEQCGEVAARRLAPQHDPFGVEPQRLGVPSYPAQGGLAVVQLSGEDGLRAEPIVDRGDREAGRREQVERTDLPRLEGRPEPSATSGPPAATVQEDNDRHGAPGRVRGGEVEIEQERAETVRCCILDPSQQPGARRCDFRGGERRGAPGHVSRPRDAGRTGSRCRTRAPRGRSVPARGCTAAGAVPGSPYGCRTRRRSARNRRWTRP